MKHYNLTYLISPDLDEKKAKDFNQSIIDSLQKEGGVLSQVKMPAKIKLAYPIKKKGRAYFFSLSFSSGPEKIQNLKEKLGSDNNILRFLILGQKPQRIKIPKKVVKIPSQKPAEKKVELKEIDKKLEEILKG